MKEDSLPLSLDNRTYEVSLKKEEPDDDALLAPQGTQPSPDVEDTSQDDSSVGGQDDAQLSAPGSPSSPAADEMAVDSSPAPASVGPSELVVRGWGGLSNIRLTTD